MLEIASQYDASAFAVLVSIGRFWLVFSTLFRLTRVIAVFHELPLTLSRARLAGAR